MRRLTLSIAASCLLTACASGPTQTVVPIQLQPEQKVPPPANLTRPPQPLPAPGSGRMRDLEADHREVARLYHELAAQMCGLLAFLDVRPTECPADAQR